MIEERCRAKIWERCQQIAYVPLVSLKGKKKPENRFENFFEGLGRYEVWDGKLAKRMMREPSRSPLRLAIGLMIKNGDRLADGFVKDKFDGNWEEAMSNYGDFGNFFKAFLDYFEERKQKFMEKTEKLIKQTHPGITENKIRTPHSHGGVANLLKVLTKTMHEQGSSIRTIAKVQYAVCTQAGIFIPDEFITDVLVAADIDPDIWDADEKNNGGHQK